MSLNLDWVGTGTIPSTRGDPIVSQAGFTSTPTQVPQPPLSEPQQFYQSQQSFNKSGQTPEVLVYGPGGGVIPSWDPNYAYYAGLQKSQPSRNIESIEETPVEAPPEVPGSWLDNVLKSFSTPGISLGLVGATYNPLEAAGLWRSSGPSSVESLETPSGQSSYIGSNLRNAALAGASSAIMVTPGVVPAAVSYGKYILGMSAISGALLPATAAIGSTDWAEAQVSKRESKGLSSAESEWNKYTNLDQYRLDLLAQKDDYINSQLASYDKESKLGSLSLSRDSYKASLEDSYSKFVNSSLDSFKPSLRWNDKVYTNKEEFIRDYTSSLGTNRTQLSKEPGFLGAMGRGIQSIWDPLFEKVDTVGNTLGPIGQLGAGVIHWSLPYSDMAKDYNKYGSGALYELVPGFGPTFGKAAITWNDIGDFERGTLIAGGVAPLVLPGLFQGAGFIGGKVGSAVFSKLPGPIQTLATSISNSRVITGANRFIVQPGLKVIASPYTAPEALGGQIVKGTGTLSYATGTGLTRAGSYVGGQVVRGANFVGPRVGRGVGIGVDAASDFIANLSPVYRTARGFGRNVVSDPPGGSSNLDPSKTSSLIRLYRGESRLYEPGVFGGPGVGASRGGTWFTTSRLEAEGYLQRFGLPTKDNSVLKAIDLPLDVVNKYLLYKPKGTIPYYKLPGDLADSASIIYKGRSPTINESIKDISVIWGKEPPLGSLKGVSYLLKSKPLISEDLSSGLGSVKQTLGDISGTSSGIQKPVTSSGGGGLEPPIRPPAPETGPSIPDDFNSRLMATQGQFSETSFIPNRLGNFSQEQINSLNKLAQEGKVVFERGEPVGYRGSGGKIIPFKSDAEAIFFRPQGVTSKIEALSPKELKALQKLSSEGKVVYADGRPATYKSSSGDFIKLSEAEKAFLSNESSIAQLKSAIAGKFVKLNSEGRLVGFETPEGFRSANTLQKELFGGYRGPVSGGGAADLTKPVNIYGEGQVFLPGQSLVEPVSLYGRQIPLVYPQGAMFTSPFLRPNSYLPTNLTSSRFGGEFLGNSLRELLIRKANVTGSPFMRLDTGEQPWFMNVRGESGPSRGSFAIQGPVPEIEGSGDLFGGRGSARPAAPSIIGGGGSGVATLVRTPSIVDARIRFEYDPLTGMLRPIYPGQPVIRPLTLRPSSPFTEYPAEPSPIPPVIPDEFTSPQPISIPSPYEEPFVTPRPTPIPPPRAQEEPIPVPYTIPQPLAIASPIPQPVPQPFRVPTPTSIPTPVPSIPRPNIPPIGPPIVPIIPLLSGLGGFGGGGGGPAHPSYPGNRGIWKFAGMGIYAPNPLPWGKRSVGGWQGRKNILYGSKVPNEPVLKKSRKSNVSSLYSSSSLRKAVTSI